MWEEDTDSQLDRYPNTLQLKTVQYGFITGCTLRMTVFKDIFPVIWVDVRRRSVYTLESAGIVAGPAVYFSLICTLSLMGE